MASNTSGSASESGSQVGEQALSSAVVSRWVAHAAENTGTANDKEPEQLLLAMQQQLGEVTETIVRNNAGDDGPRVGDELDKLGGLLLQLHEVCQLDRETDFVGNQVSQPEPQTDAHHETETDTDCGHDHHDHHDHNDQHEHHGHHDHHADCNQCGQDLDESAIRARAESLVEQGVSSVSRMSNTISKEFEHVDRREITQIASEVRSEAGEMETQGSVETLVDR